MRQAPGKTESAPPLTEAELVSSTHKALPVFKLSEKHTSPPAIALFQAKSAKGKLFEYTGANVKESNEPCFVYTVFLNSFSKSVVEDIIRNIEALARLDGYNFLKVYGIHRDKESNSLLITTECPPTITLQTVFQDNIITKRIMTEEEIIPLYIQYLHVAEYLSEQKSLPPDLMRYLIDPKVTLFKTRELIKINTIEAYMAYLSSKLELPVDDAYLVETTPDLNKLPMSRGPSIGIGLRATSTIYGGSSSIRSDSLNSSLSASVLGPSNHSLSTNSLEGSYYLLGSLVSSQRSVSRATSAMSTNKTLQARKSAEETLLNLINQLILMITVVPQLPAQLSCEENPDIALSIVNSSFSKNFRQILRPQQILEELSGRKVTASLLSYSMTGPTRCERIGYAGALILNNLNSVTNTQIQSNDIDAEGSSNTSYSEGSESSGDSSRVQQLTINEAVLKFFPDNFPWISTIFVMEPFRTVENSIRTTFYPDGMGVTSLMKAAISNDVSLALDYIYQAGIRDSAGNSALMYCARCNSADVAKLLLKTETGLRNKRKESALMIAVEYGSIDAVRLLADAELGMRGLGIRNPLMLAFQSQNTNILQILLETGLEQGIVAQLATNESTGATYLMRAVEIGDLELIRLLIPYLAKAMNKNGMTALMLACENGRTEEGLELVNAEAGIKGPDGMTALMYAAMNNNKILVKALVEKEAGMITESGEFALHLAFISRAEDSINVLLSYENELLKKCKFTPLMKAVACYNINSFKVMQKSFAGRTDSFGYTALMFACIFNRKDAVEALLPDEGDIVLVNGITPFVLALRNGSTEAINAIITYYEETLPAQDNCSSHTATKGLLASFISNNSLTDASSSSHTATTPQSPNQSSPIRETPHSLIGSSLSLSTSALHSANRVADSGMLRSTDVTDKGNTEGTRLLSPNIVKVWNTAVSKPGPEALMNAVISNDIDTVFSLRKTHAKHTDNKGATALIIALRKGLYDVAMILARHEYGVQDSLKKTALMCCIDRQSLRLIDVLGPHEKGLVDFKGKTALYHAYDAKNLVIMERLCKYEADLPIPILEKSKAGMTLLMLAAQDGDCARLRILLPYQAGKRDSTGWCASRYAIEMGNVACLNLLIEHERSLLEEDGFTPLMIAVALHSADPITKYKDNIRKHTKDGNTALMIAVYSHNTSAMKQLLISEKGMRRPDGRTALMIAAEKDNAEACRILAPHESGVRLSSDIQLTNKQEIGKPVALMLAVRAKSVRCLRWLSEYEKNLTETKQQMTSLMIAAQIGHIEAVQVLRAVEAGEQDSLGWTALMHATAWDHLNVVRYLVPYEFDLVDENDQSVLDLAVKYEQLSCIKALAPACAPQFGEAALRKLDASRAREAIRAEIHSEIRRYLRFGQT